MASERPAHPFEGLGEGPTIINEGRASIKFPKGEVFYNPVQQFNRDLSITVIKSFAKEYLAGKRKQHLQGITVLEALSATGLRSIRYAKEIPGIAKIIANDMDSAAVDLIRENVKSNSESGSELGKVILPNQDDANTAMHKFKAEGLSLDVVDLDPYGSAAPFIDSAVQSVADGGLLCVTCTDLAVLCATRQETCFAKYGGLPVKGDVCHEAALRLILQTIEASANRYRRHIVPLMSCSIDFYARVFVRVFESPANVKLSATKRGLVGKCVQCRSLSHQPFMTVNMEGKQQVFSTRPDAVISEKCTVCDSRMELCGPMWLGPIHDAQFVKQVLDTAMLPENNYMGTRDRIQGFASIIYEELCNPLFMSLPEMASFLKTSVPPLLKFRSALLNAGFDVSGSHCEAQAIKTNAPNSFLWEALIRWIHENGAKKEFAVDTPQLRMVEKLEQFKTAISFERHPLANPSSRDLKLKRFPENPTKNWGPLARAKQSKKDA